MYTIHAAIFAVLADFLAVNCIFCGLFVKSHTAPALHCPGALCDGATVHAFYSGRSGL